MKDILRKIWNRSRPLYVTCWCTGASTCILAWLIYGFHLTVLPQTFFQFRSELDALGEKNFFFQMLFQPGDNKGGPGNGRNPTGAVMGDVTTAWLKTSTQIYCRIIPSIQTLCDFMNNAIWFALNKIDDHQIEIEIMFGAGWIFNYIYIYFKL